MGAWLRIDSKRAYVRIQAHSRVVISDIEDGFANIKDLKTTATDWIPDPDSVVIGS